MQNSTRKIRNRKFRAHFVPLNGSGFLAAIAALALCCPTIRANAQTAPAKTATAPAKNPSGAAELPEVKPESVGFSSQRLTHLESAMQSAMTKNNSPAA